MTQEEGTGAAGEIRTPDPRITNALLYQLSYSGKMAGEIRIFVLRKPSSLTRDSCNI